MEHTRKRDDENENRRMKSSKDSTPREYTTDTRHKQKTTLMEPYNQERDRQHRRGQSSSDSQRHKTRHMDAYTSYDEQLLAEAMVVTRKEYNYNFLDDLVAEVNSDDRRIKLVFHEGTLPNNIEAFGIIVTYRDEIYKILVHYHTFEGDYNYIHAKFYGDDGSPSTHISDTVIIVGTPIHNALKKSKATSKYFRK